jgi:hypothetical protein
MSAKVYSYHLHSVANAELSEGVKGRSFAFDAAANCNGF